MKRSRLGLALGTLSIVVVTGCSAHPLPSERLASAAPITFDEIDADEPHALPSHRPMPDPAPGPIGRAVSPPTSAAIEEGVAYRFSLGHCGLHSPVDVDGSFWDAVEGVSAGGAPIDFERNPEMINATAGVIVVIGDEARFRTDGGSLIRFERHPGNEHFEACY